MADILWPAHDVTVSQLDTASLSAAAVEQYLVVPNLRKPRILLPAGSPAAAASAVMSYNKLRPIMRRAARAVLGQALRGRVAERLLRGRLTVHRDGRIRALESVLLSEHLRQILDVREVVKLAVGIPRRGPFAKPVVQASTSDGTVRGYAKVGWNAVTARLVKTEAAFLASPPDLKRIVIPTLIHEGSWRDRAVGVTAPLPQDVRRYGSLSTPPPLGPTREIAETSVVRQSALATSTYWQRLRSHLAGVLDGTSGRDADIVGACLERVEARHGDASLIFGRWHGDWVPWNLGRHGARIVAWDWEHTEPDVPLGFDILHFLFQVSFIGRQHTLQQTIASWRGAAPSALRAVGLQPQAHAAVTSAYLLTMYSRHYRALRAGAVPNPRFHPGILDVLATVGR